MYNLTLSQIISQFVTTIDGLYMYIVKKYCLLRWLKNWNKKCNMSELFKASKFVYQSTIIFFLILSVRLKTR